MMLISIDPNNGLAIYEQIGRQVKYAVAHEELRSGELIPSVRELARDLAVNPNTVSRAYRELQSEGILETVRGTGLQVTSSAVERCRRQRLDLIRQRLRSVLREARQSGLQVREIRRILKEETADLNVTRTPPCPPSSSSTV